MKARSRSCDASAALFCAHSPDKPARFGVLLGLAVIIIIGASALLTAKKEPTYKNKTLSKWFYGQKNDFFAESKMLAADDAINALGTNALPFLFANLSAQGDSALYFRIYRLTPGLFRTLLPYPISGDDIHWMALTHMRSFSSMPSNAVVKLSRLVPGLSNPALRTFGLQIVQARASEVAAAPCIMLCQDLLADPSSGVQLVAAIMLAQLDHTQTKGFPILIAAFTNQQQLDSALSSTRYRLQQPPGGWTNTSAAMPPVVALRQATQRAILMALEQLQPNLDDQQKALIRGYDSASAGKRGP